MTRVSAWRLSLIVANGGSVALEADYLGRPWRLVIPDVYHALLSMSSLMLPEVR